MGRKRLYETSDDKKQAQHEYYDKTKDEYKRFYQLASKKYMMNKQLKKCEEKLNVLHVNMEDSKAIQLQTQMKIDKLKARIAKYKEQLPIVIERLEIERKKKWNSDYHTKAVYKQKLLTPEEKEAINTQLISIENNIANITDQIAEIRDKLDNAEK